MTTIPTYGICTFVTDANSPDEVLIHPKENPAEKLFIRRYAPYADEYAHVAVPHKHNFYKMILVLNGKGTTTVDFEEYPIEQSTAYFLIPGQVHDYNIIGKLNMYGVDFSEGYFRSFLQDDHYYERFPFFQGNISDSIIKVSPDILKKVRGLLDAIIEEGHHHRAASDDLIKIWILEVLMLMARQCDDNGIKNPIHKTSSLISKFRKLVDENFRKLSLPKDYAVLLFVTPNYLNQMCHKILGKTAGEVIRARKLLEAKRLLVNLDLNVSQIAYDLNFTDASHFSKFFKKHSGKSPEEFRKSAFVTIE